MNTYQKYRESKLKWKRLRFETRRREFIKQLGGICRHCGTTYDLTYDHIDRSTKEFCIGANLHRSMQSLQTELKKCRLLCRSCHGTKSQKERLHDTSHRHGIVSTYTNLKCRCSDCKKVWHDYCRTYYSKLIKSKQAGQ